MQPFSAVMLRRCTFIVSAALLCAATAFAQATATAGVGVTASVIGGRSIQVLAALGVNNLAFGVVNAGGTGVPASIATDAGRFSIVGEQDTPVTLSFTLPVVLDGPGGATIPIIFTGNDGIEWIA